MVSIPALEEPIRGTSHIPQSLRSHAHPVGVARDVGGSGA